MVAVLSAARWFGGMGLGLCEESNQKEKATKPVVLDMLNAESRLPLDLRRAYALSFCFVQPLQFADRGQPFALVQQ
jgi:hypothetical protein